MHITSDRFDGVKVALNIFYALGRSRLRVWLVGCPRSRADPATLQRCEDGRVWHKPNQNRCPLFCRCWGTSGHRWTGPASKSLKLRTDEPQVDLAPVSPRLG